MQRTSDKGLHLMREIKVKETEIAQIEQECQLRTTENDRTQQRMNDL